VLINQTLPFFFPFFLFSHFFSFGIGGISRPIKIAIKIAPAIKSALSRLLARLCRDNGLLGEKKNMK